MASGSWQTPDINSQQSQYISQEKKTENQLRFQIELEFVQSLANPHYLNFLAQRGCLKDQNMINYLKYLQYWKDPQYSKYLKYPQCLYLLDLLQYDAFRQELVNTQCAKFIDDQQLLHWQHYQRKRARLISGQQQQNSGAATGNHPPTQQVINTNTR